MSARNAIEATQPAPVVREDLVLAAFAVANGFTLCNRYAQQLKPEHLSGGVPLDPLAFRLGACTVWATERGWRVARMTQQGGNYAPADHQFHPQLLPALEAALWLESGT